MKKRVVVTGATGFVGSHLVNALLEKGYEVFVISRLESDFSSLKKIDETHIFRYSGDIMQMVSFFKKIQPIGVFHLASKFIAEHKTEEVDTLINSNILFSTQLLEAMKEANVKNLINTGTSWQYYNNDDYNPVCLYAATKQAFEAIIEYYIQAGDFKVITLVLFDTYGENDTRPKLMNLLKKVATEGTALDMSAGEQQLSLVHIADVCRAFILAFEMLETQQINKHKHYAIISDEIYSLKEIVQIFERQTNKNLNITFGKRPYRKREVMKVWDKGEKLPNWKAEISLEEGINLYKSNSKKL